MLIRRAALFQLLYPLAVATVRTQEALRGAERRLASCDPSCEVWQQCVGGTCKNCPRGEIGDGSSCKDCPDGQVRGDATGELLAACTDAAGICGVWQFARYGYCEDCPRGEVGYLNSYESCTDCPDGQVRGDATGRSEDGCVDAEDECGVWQFARYGYCEDCPRGEVGYLNSYESCTDCPDGQVRGDREGRALADCVLAQHQCTWDEFARYGYCEPCPKGEVGYLSSPPYTSCKDCPDGQVRRRSDGIDHSYCVGACLPWEFARYGYCEECGKGEVGYMTDFKSCTDCPDGSVRGDAGGTLLSLCVDAGEWPDPLGYNKCKPWEFARYGYCEECGKGEVGYLTNFKSCKDCPDGSVRGNAEGTQFSACVPAKTKCSDTQFARYGYCEECGGSKVANEDHTQCVSPPS